MNDAGPAPIRIRVAVCLCEDQRILLVQHEKRGHRYWLLPGGGVEPGETIMAALERELIEETGLTIEVGRLIIVCEVIDPGRRHIVNLVFAGRVTGGQLSVGFDGVLVDARWQPRAALGSLEIYPHLAADVNQCWDEGFEGPVRFLGDVWRPKPAS
ncbi:MAG: NUDIX domain-containing protein [Candidatus Dormibacteria bacterium]